MKGQSYSMLEHVFIHEILRKKTVFYPATMLIMTRITAMMMFLLVVMAGVMEKELSVLNMHREFIMQVRNRKESNYKE